MSSVARPDDRTWPVHAVLFASVSVMTGVLWDISWHQSIGRDTFWTPAHMAIYVGGLAAGIACGWLILKTTFAGTDEEVGRSVRIWGFRAPLGAWVGTWGSIAMLTSAPFDDWWHNAYGLDVEIISPPHALLALGIWAINLGALLMVLPHQARAEQVGEARRWGRLHAVAAGLLLLMVAVFLSEYHFRLFMHSSRFYTSAAIAFPVVLVAAARSSPLRWPATTIVAVYMMAKLVTIWILPLFPAEPKLAPIFQPVDRMVPPDFPLLLIVPALGMDLVAQRWDRARSDWLLAGILGLTFFVLFLAAQWPFSFFLQSELSANWLFATDNAPYTVPDGSYWMRREFYPWNAGAGELRVRLGVACLFAVASARVGLWWGGWMERVRR